MVNVSLSLMIHSMMACVWARIWIVVLIAVSPSLAALHPSSPCPNVFTYEGAEPDAERWYGIVLLNTDESLVGVRIDIKLDRSAELLVSWMGSVTTSDNELFRVLNLDQKLHPGPPIPSRFMVKFNAIKGAPQVRTIRLNGRQICPPDPNFPTDTHYGSQDHLHENRYTTERVTRRPDLDLDDDWTNSRPVNPPRNPSTIDSYRPPVRQTPTYNSHEQGGYSSSSGGGYSNSKKPAGDGHGSAGYSPSQTSVSSGHGSASGSVYSQNENGNSHSSSDSNGYSNLQQGGTNSHSLSSGSGYTYTRDTTTYGYDSHESYHGNRKPSGSGVGSSYSNTSRPSSSGSQNHQNVRPLVTYTSDHDTPPIPSININIKDVTYNVDRPGTSNHSPESSGVNSPPHEREPSYSSSQNRKTTERYNEPYGGSSFEDYQPKTTTKKPVVINSINININNGDSDSQPLSSVYVSPQIKPTTKRPNISNSRNNTNTNRQTTRKPTASSQRPSSSNGHQTSRPPRNPEISSSESHYQPGYGQNSEKTTEKNYHSNSQGSQKQPSISEYDSSRPSAIPSSRPHSGDANHNIPRPQMASRPAHGEDGEMEVSNLNIKCGTVEVNAAPLITHGQNTARGQWPWHIALYRIDGINLSYSCGGSLISSTVVVTAAHCVTKAPRDRPVDSDILVVQLGKYHLYQFSDDSVQNKQVREVYVHPRYNSSNYLDDVAILVLSSPAEFTKYVRPVCLWPKHNFNLRNIHDKEGTVVGWGYDENNQVTEELKMAVMPVVSYVTCLRSYPQFFSQFTAENKTFCAGFRQGTSVCNGDSGGGMVFQQAGAWYLRGLVSITVAKQGLRVCDTNHYVVFTDLAYYTDWISQYL